MPEEAQAQPQPGPPSELSLRLREVLRATHETNQGLARRLGLGVTDVIALDHLGAGPLGPVELGDRLGMRSASATALVDRLETAGHVQRQPHPSDRRRLTVVPTTSAIREVVQALRPLLADLDAAAAELTPDQQQAVARYLERVAHALHRFGQREP